MADQPVTREKLINADKDVQVIEDFIKKSKDETVTTRFGDQIMTLKGLEDEVKKSGGYFKRYTTLAAANADIANIPVNSVVKVTDAVDGGDYEKQTADATSLTKSPYDPVEQAKNYADSLVDDVPIKNKSDLDDLAVSVAFSDNSRTWLEANKSGRPSEHSKSILKEEFNIDDNEDYNEYAVAFAFQDDSILFGFDKEANPKFYGKNPYNAYGFVAYGDSTTEGADLVNPLTERWTTLLSAQIGKAIENRGISGARAEEIQARFGAINANMSVANSTIPASGIVILTAVDINPVRLGGSLQVELLCEDFTKVKGTLARASDTTATFTRSIAGSAITTNRVKVISTSQQGNRSKIMFLGQGINNEGLVSAGTQTLDQIKSWYKSGVTHLSAANPEYVVWGVLDRGASEAVGTPNGDFIKDLEAWLLVEFGSRYAPVRQFLSSQYAIDVAEILEPSFTPTTADTDAIAVGRTPPSFRYTTGSVHLNALGHKLQTWFFKQHLISRGII